MKKPEIGRVEHAGRRVRVLLTRSYENIGAEAVMANRTKLLVTLAVSLSTADVEISLPADKARDLAKILVEAADCVLVKEIMAQ